MSGRPALDRAQLQAHTTCIKKLDRRGEDRLVELVSLAIDRYLDGWGEFYTQESARLFRVQEHIDRALAAIIVDAWTLDEDDEFRPFHDEAGCYAWLQGEGENSNNSVADLSTSNNWKIRSLWNVRQETDTEIGNLDAWDKARWKHHWTRPPETTSRLPTTLQEMIFDLCQAWHDLIDEKLGLPRRDPNPNNPLLRYIDYCLTIALGEQRPAPKTVLQLVHDHIRPAIHAQAEEDRRHDEERRQFESKFAGVDFDIFGED